MENGENTRIWGEEVDISLSSKEMKVYSGDHSSNVRRLRVHNNE